MNKNYKVSLIMPAYNISSVLERSIDSVLNQTYRNIELVIVDDGSTDLSSNIIDQYAKSHSNIIPIHRKNGGVFSARIDGVNQASGEFIGFIDGDDYMEPEMIEQLIKMLLNMMRIFHIADIKWFFLIIELTIIMEQGG